MSIGFPVARPELAFDGLFLAVRGEPAVVSVVLAPLGERRRRTSIRSLALSYGALRRQAVRAMLRPTSPLFRSDERQTTPRGRGGSGWQGRFVSFGASFRASFRLLEASTA